MTEEACLKNALHQPQRILVGIYFLTLFFVTLQADFAQAKPLRLRAIPLTALDLRLVNKYGLLVGYNDDGDLVSYSVLDIHPHVLLPEARYEISLRSLSDDGRVTYVRNDDTIQTVNMIKLTGDKVSPPQEILRRDVSQSDDTVITNKRGDVLVVESEGDLRYLVLRASGKPLKKTVVPEDFEPLFLSDSRQAYGVYREENEETGESLRYVLRVDFSKRKIRLKKSAPIDRRIYSIVHAAGSSKLYGIAAPPDNDESNSLNIVFELKFPKALFKTLSTLAEDEELEGYWKTQLLFYDRDYDDSGRVNRILTSSGKSTQLSCAGLQNLYFRFQASAPNDFALGQIQGSDSQNQFRNELMLFVPKKSPFGKKLPGQFQCQIPK